MNRSETERYIGEIYNTDMEFPWIKYPDYAVFRHAENRKWFAVIMPVSNSKLGIDKDGTADIINLKCGAVMSGSLRAEQGIFPAYHMNKSNWVTVLLDGSVSDEKIKMLLDLSFSLTAAKKK